MIFVHNENNSIIQGVPEYVICVKLLENLLSYFGLIDTQDIGNNTAHKFKDIQTFCILMFSA